MSDLSTVIMAPMTSKSFPLPMRVPIRFQNTSGLILLDQIRAVDKARLLKKLSSVTQTTQNKIAGVLVEMMTF